jgi:hypothetical protein
VRGAGAEKQWADAIEDVLTHPRAAFARAADLRRQILARVSWEQSVASLLAALG